MIGWSYTIVAGGPASSTSGIAVLALDPITGDLELPLRVLRGPDAIVQRIRQRLSTFRGSWFLDTRIGVPYFRDVLVKNPVRAVVERVIRDTISGTPGVREVVSLDYSLDKRTRAASISFTARLEGDATIRVIDAPLLLDREFQA